MSIVEILAVFACAIATLLGGLRWLRVAQREHYLAPWLVVFWGRWWLRDAIGPLLGSCAIAAAAVSLFYPATAFFTALVIAGYPLGLGLRGRSSKLSWTRRMRTLAGASAVLCAIPTVAAGALGGLKVAVFAAAFVALATPFLIAVTLVVLWPLEDALATRHLERATRRLGRVRPTVVGITGSYGKTSTKGYLAHILLGRFSVLASPRSFNNRAGLSRAVNEYLVEGTEVFIAEMGAYGPGEIAALCAWLHPKVSIITAIGPVHLERFKTLDRTLRAKAEILEHAEVAVLNVDDERLSGLADECLASGRSVIKCSGRKENADVAVLIDEHGLDLFVKDAHIGHVELANQENAPVATNVACAIGAALALGCEPTDVLGRLGDLPVLESRLAATRAASGAMVLDDTFNSNPAGVQRALASFVSLSVPGKRRILVTPGMVELGSQQATENAAFASEAARLATDVIIVGRTNRRALLRGIRAVENEDATERSGQSDARLHVVEVRTRDEAVAYVRSVSQADDIVLYENDLPDHFP